MTSPSRESYRAIVADPPWPLKWCMRSETKRRNGRGERHRIVKKDIGYKVMSIDVIAALAVSELAAADAHLYLWAPDQFVLNGTAVDVVKAWGFKPLRLIVWGKRNFGLGVFPRPQHELLIVCRRGRLPFRVRDVGSLLVADHPRRPDGAKIHSAKPDAFLDIVERASPGPYLELFARRRRLGWHAWGNEVDSDVELDHAA
jgi:N6-adenosine-specific RNA methylase IME4